MKTNNKTLADVQPGGSVRLGDAELRKAIADVVAESRTVAHVAAMGNQTDDAQRCLDAAQQRLESALSAQPSPGGQGDALTMIGANLRSVMRLCRPEDYSISRLDAANIHMEARHALQLLEAALAARQPVSEADAYQQGFRDGQDRTCTVVASQPVASNQPSGNSGELDVDAAREPVGETFQSGVAEWMDQCFLPSLYSNMTERGDRLLEEVLELLQAHGYDKARVPTLVDYVFSRPVGDPAQEVGGVMVTLAGYCWVAGLDMHAAGDAELARINQPEVMDKIRRKQEAKNALHFDTPLPGHAAPTAQAVDLPYSLDADPAGIRARVADVITGTLMVGAQGHTPPPDGHWAEPFWKAARADAAAQAVDLGPSIPSELAPVAAALKRFNECAEDRDSDGCDIGRDWFDALTTIGLLKRTQRSPAVWTMTAEGERLLALIDGKAVGK